MREPDSSYPENVETARRFCSTTDPFGPRGDTIPIPEILWT
jgi:hypothetical protein